MKIRQMSFKANSTNWLLLLIIVITTSCQKKETTPEPTTKPAPASHCNCENEVAFPDIKGEVISLKDRNNKEMVSLVRKGDKYILGGDIILTEEQVNTIKKKIANPPIPIYKPTDSIHTPSGIQPNTRKSNTRKLPDWKPDNELYRTAITNATNYWRNRTVYYTINSAVPNQSRITNAIAHWESNTNIHFVLRTTQAHYVEFVNTDAECYSDLGMIGGRQILNVGDGCSTGNVMHEIGHTLGFLHEQIRSDRDNFIIVYPNNIKPNFLSQFTKYNDYHGTNWGFETDTYDFGSIMNYGSFDFRSGTQATMTRLDGTFFFGQRDGLSAGDIATYNLMYNPTRFARIEYENYSYNWYSNSRFFTDSDAYIRFYSDANCTVPANPVVKAIYTMSYLNDGVSYSFLYEIPTTTNSIALGNLRLEDYYEDSSGEGHSSGVAIQLPEYVGYTLLPYYIHP
ncbi:MAG: M12 family metallopeptidase [Chitinophaga sp.]|uniref:M12 family metallopeptidase n=1 Tax=Chitinophaga sp. TaxID=1869181 RepID=UPI001B2DDBF8|nr:M12 family metallopeptidase [Chitinophaga sp.]MBO9732026.1 M12 family metallopeptidase [Chitinophaga sp.]